MATRSPGSPPAKAKAPHAAPKASLPKATPKAASAPAAVAEPDAPVDLKVGDRIALVQSPDIEGVVRFVGTTKFSDGEWIGVELDQAKGKNDGSVRGDRYFNCKEQHGVFVRSNGVKKCGSVDEKTDSRSSLADVRKGSSKYTGGLRKNGSNGSTPTLRVSAAINDISEEIQVKKSLSEVSKNNDENDHRSLKIALAEAMEERDVLEISRLVCKCEESGFNEDELGPAKRLLDSSKSKVGRSSLGALGERTSQVPPAATVDVTSLTDAMKDILEEFKGEMASVTDEIKAAFNGFKRDAPAAPLDIPGNVDSASKSRDPELAALNVKLDSIMEMLAKGAPPDSNVKLQTILASLETKLEKMPRLSSSPLATDAAPLPPLGAEVEKMLEVQKSMQGSMAELVLPVLQKVGDVPAQIDRLSNQLSRELVDMKNRLQAGSMPSSAVIGDGPMQTQRNPEDTELDACVLKVQALQRGRDARQQIDQLRATDGNNVDAEVAAADAELDAAAVKIQALTRGKAARNDTEKLKDGVNANAAVDPEVAAAALRVQAIQRGKVGMDEVGKMMAANADLAPHDAWKTAADDELEAAALRVQALQRGRAGRSIISNMEAQRDAQATNDGLVISGDAELEDAARKIQELQRIRQSESQIVNVQP